MSYPINYPTPQGANVQIFTANTIATSGSNPTTWVKPQGASMVWFTLIGSGGSGGNATSDASAGTAAAGGGGSGAVTNCIVPAFLIPDILQIRVYSGNFSNNTEIFYQNKTGNGYSLLIATTGADGGNASSTGGGANYGAGGVAGTASPANKFSAAGFFQSVAGQAGTSGTVGQTTSTTTFLQGGVGGNSTASQDPSQYGYGRSDYNTANQNGYSVLRPIIVGVASTRAGLTFTTADAALASGNGFGCGGGGAFTSSASTTRYGTRGGDGLVVIVTW